MDGYHLLYLGTGSDESDLYLSDDETTVMIQWLDGRIEFVSAHDFFGSGSLTYDVE